MSAPVITLPPVQATGGKVTVMRTLAAASYGNYTVEYPDNVEPDYTPEGAREDGYVATLPVATRRRIGGLGRRFIRADLNVSAKDNTSDVEEKLDLAATRTEGDIYFETDIDETGLGRLIPYVHFTIGDWLNVLIWGLTIPGPVTKIERTITNGIPTGWSIHIGGQLISDEDARRAANADTEAKLLQEQRERVQAVGDVERKASGAQSTAEGAQETADEAESTASEARDTAESALSQVSDADGAFQSRLEETRRLIEEGRGHAQQVAGHVAEAGRLSGDAQDYAREAVEAADQADQILVRVEGDLEASQTALAEVTALHKTVVEKTAAAQQAVADGQAHVTEAGRLVGVAQSHASSALDYAREAGVLVDEAEQLNASVSSMTAQVETLVAEGTASAQAAQAAATTAQEHAATVQAAVAEARGLLDSTGDAAESAQDALASARDELALLDDVDGEGTSLTGLLARVVTLHQETLAAHDATITRHGEVLVAHTEALQAVSDAAGQASAAAADAADAAQAALDAHEVQREINDTQQKINDLYARAIRAAAASSAQAGMAAMQAAMAAQEAKDAAQSALDAAAANAESIRVLEEADVKLQEAIGHNEDAIAKLRDAQVLMDEAIRAAAAAAESAGTAAAQSGVAAEEAGKSASSALEATAALEDAVGAAEEAQQARNDAVQAALTRHGNQTVLHDNALKWQRWRNPVFDFTFTRASGQQWNVSDTLITGLLDSEFNIFQGKGARIICRPGWRGRFQLMLEYTDDSQDTINGRALGVTASWDQSYSLTRTVKRATIHVWPDHGVQPREWAIPVDEQGRWAATDWAQFITKDDVTGWIRFPTSVIPSRDIQAREPGYPAETFSSDRAIPTTHWVVPDGEDDVVIFTEEQGTLVWEIGAPSSGRQRINVASRTPARHTWTTVASWRGLDWSSPVDAQLQFFIRWDTKNSFASTNYSTRILVDGTDIGQLNRGGFGSINLDFNLVRQHTLQPGSQIQFQVHSNAGISSERRVSSGYALITWG